VSLAGHDIEAGAEVFIDGLRLAGDSTMTRLFSFWKRPLRALLREYLANFDPLDVLSPMDDIGAGNAGRIGGFA